MALFSRDFFARGVVGGEVVLQFGKGEDALGGTDVPHATGTEGTAPGHAFDRRQLAVHRGNETAVERITGACSADEPGRENADAEFFPCGIVKRPLLAAGNDSGLRPGVKEKLRLIERIGQMTDAFGFVIVGNEDVRVGQQRLDRVPIWPVAVQHNIKDNAAAAFPGALEDFDGRGYLSLRV